MNGWANWPGARLTSEALKNGPAPSTSPNDIAYRRSRYSVRCSSFLRLSRIASTPLSLSTAGLSCVRLSLTRPDIWCETAVRLFINASTELRCDRSSAKQGVGVDDKAGNLITALRQHCGDLVRVGQQVAQLRVAVVEGVGEPCHALQRDLQIGRGVFEGVRQRRQRRGQLRGVQSADGGGQVAQRVRQVVGRFRPLDRNRSRSSSPSPRGRHLEKLGTQHGFGLDRGLGPVTQFDAVVDREVHQHLRAFEADVGDPADRHARHPHVAAGLDASGLSEVGGVIGLALMNGIFS